MFVLIVLSVVKIFYKGDYMDLSNLFIKFLSKQLKLKNLPERWDAIKNLGKSKNLDIPNN